MHVEVGNMKSWPISKLTLLQHYQLVWKVNDCRNVKVLYHKYIKKGNAGVTNQLQSDGPRNADDLFAQIFTKIQHDKNTFIHFSTIKDQVSLRRQEEGSIFCEALTHGERTFLRPLFSKKI